MLKVLIVILIILFIPIPIKLRVVYSSSGFCIFIFNFRIYPKKTSKVKALKKKFASLQTLSSTKLFHNLKSNNLKFSLYINIKLFFGTDDAKTTAEVYGALSSLNTVLFLTINSCFNIKKYNYVLEPRFNEEIIYLECKSIILVDLVKFINIVFILFKSKNNIHKSTLNNRRYTHGKSSN